MPDESKALLILNATGELLDETAFDDLNTTEIARRAGVSTATLYRHFPDKYAILRALVFHLQAQRSESASRHFARFEVEADWRRVIRDSVNEMYALRLSQPGGRATRRMMGYSAELLAFGRESSARVGREAGMRLMRRNPALTRATAERISIASVTALTALLDLACDDPRSGKRYLAEAVEMCCAYLSPHLD